METDMDYYKLKAYTLPDGFVGSLDLRNEDLPQPSDNVLYTVVIVDRSGSMGGYVAKVVNEMLPLLFEKLSYDPKTCIHLITFESEVEYLIIKIEELKNLPMECRGYTYMTGAVTKLKELFENFDVNRPVRILTISDGEIFDPYEVTRAGDEIATRVFNTRVNSQAVRLFTSRNQPDTRALCSLLQLNNTVSSTLLDIEASAPIEVMAENIADMFNSDGFSKGFALTSESSVFLNFPWEQNASNKLNMTTGHNVFWMKEIPTTDITLGDVPVRVSVEPELTLDEFYALLGSKFNYIISHMKVLKIVGTEEAKETSQRILNYFTEQEKILDRAVEEFPGESMRLHNRVKRTIILKRRKNLSMILATIANDDNVTHLNSAQKADYLRKVDFSRTSRSLAKRAARGSLDFDEMARSEVLNMSHHFDEIQDIDDSNHLISFFSQDTTLGGIKTLVEVSQHIDFLTFDVDDILQLLNLVGVACSGKIGDFPDPMTWRVDEIFLGCNISVSDLLVAFNQSNGQNLKVPAIDKEITNVIPVFDDPRIAIFLKKYAPSLLEYTFSIGMRRIIADIPMTMGYTMSAGIWKMISEINNNKSSLHLSVLQQLLTTFDNYVGRYFDHIMPFLKDQENGKLSFYIGYNGISNMMCPIIRIFKTKDEEKLKLLPDILRAVYYHETWQGVRRAYKGKTDADEIIKKMLYELLGIDLNQHMTPLPKLFEDVPDINDITFYDEPQIDDSYLIKITDRISYINNLVLIPKYFDAAIKDDLNSIKEIPKLSDTMVLETLQIDYPYNMFMFFNVFQALRYTTRASREDISEEKMKIFDLKSKDEIMSDVKDYIREQFKAQYLSELPNKHEQEKLLVGDKLAVKIIEAKTYNEMIDAWRNGISVNLLNFTIESPTSPGYTTLCTMLCDSKVPSQRSNIFKVLLLGVDNDMKPVWGGIKAVTRKQKRISGPTRAFWAPGPELIFLKH